MPHADIARGDDGACALAMAVRASAAEVLHAQPSTHLAARVISISRHTGISESQDSTRGARAMCRAVQLASSLLCALVSGPSTSTASTQERVQLAIKQRAGMSGAIWLQPSTRTHPVSLLLPLAVWWQFKPRCSVWHLLRHDSHVPNVNAGQSSTLACTRQRRLVSSRTGTVAQRLFASRASRASRA